MPVLIQTLSILALVIVVSMGVAVVIKVIGLVLGRGADRPAPAAEPAPAPAGTDPGVPPPEHVVAIAAAVAHVLGGQVVHIEPTRRDAWSSLGRQAHHGSHNLGRRS